MADGSDDAGRTVFLCLLPSTVQSSIAFTAIAGGNVAAAVCSASLSNILGKCHHACAGGDADADGGGRVPWMPSGKSPCNCCCSSWFGICQLWLKGYLDRNKKPIGRVDRGSIPLVVYTAFFRFGGREGPVSKVGLSDLGLHVQANQRHSWSLWF